MQESIPSTKSCKTEDVKTSYETGEQVKDPVAEVFEMISEAENKVCKTSKQRVTRLIELDAMKVRQVKASNRSNEGLLRRYRREQGTDGQHKQLQTQLKNMQTDLRKEKDPTRSKVCFITQTSAFQETKEVLEDDQQVEKILEMKSAPWETFFGLVGIPVSHTIQNYTDPMNIGINEHLKEVVSSSECALNQKSLWSLSGSENTFVNLDNLVDTWGFKNKVTAVVPIKSWNDPTVWRAYHNGPLFKMATSSQLRGARMPMQQDQVALTSASLLWTVKEWGSPNKTQASLMVDLLDTIQFTDPRSQGVPAEITEFMEQTEMHIVNNMPSALAPMSKMLQSKYVLRFAGSGESSHFWRAMVSNSIYWKVRRAMFGKNRDEVFRALANFKTKSINDEVLLPFDEDLTVFARMFKIAQRYRKLDKIGENLFEDFHENVEEFKKFLTTSNYKLFLLTEVVRALICCRKVTKKLKLPNLDTEAEKWEWMIEEHDRREQLGIDSDQIDNAEAWEGFLRDAPAQSLHEFATSLNEAIPNEFEKFKTSDPERKHKFKIEEVYDRLSTTTTAEVKDKLKLILYGEVTNGPKWGNGKGLKNGKVAKKILEKLRPMVTTEDGTKDFRKLESLIEKSNRFTKHWYRKMGSRKNYTNDRPSFWAITNHTTPWAFLKNDKEGYDQFLENLKDIAEDKDTAKENFFQDWQHLLIQEPTKDDVQARRQVNSARAQLCSKFPPCQMRSRNPSESLPDERVVSFKDGNRLFSIFPHPGNSTFGLTSLMEASKISLEDLTIGKATLEEAAANVASNWETILLRMLPSGEAKEASHSLNEVFGIDENSFKAFNAFKLLKKMPDIHERKSVLVDALKEASQTRNENCLIETNERDKSSEIWMSDAQIKVFEKNSTRILERLLPLQAVELTSAIGALFKKDHARKMAAVYHVLQRYMVYGFTSMNALTKLLSDEKLIDSTEDILTWDEQFELVHPAVSFELKFDVEGTRTEEAMKKNVQDTLNILIEDKNALLWMNQEYERTRSANNWEPLEVSKTDLDSVEISVDDVWYGGGPHEKVTIEFKYEKYKSFGEIPHEERKRLKQLKDFFELVLHNIYQLVPTDEEFVKDGKKYVSTKKPEAGDKTYETHEYKVPEEEHKIVKLFKGMMKSKTVVDETATILKSLGDKGAKYNTAQKILELLDKKSDVDNLTIRVQKKKRGCPVRVIASAPVFVRVEKETRFRELPTPIVDRINQLMTRVLLTEELESKYEEIFDILINTPGLFDVYEDRLELANQIRNFKLTPRSLITAVLNKCQDVNGTLGRLMDSFDKFQKEHSNNETYASAMTALKDGMDAIAQDARKLSEKEAKKQLANDKSFRTFLKFLVDHHPDGMKRYANAKGYRRDKFLELAKNAQILPGDMIGFYRKNLGIQYAHAGIYAPYNNQMYVIHVQGQGGWLRSMRKCAEVKCEKLEDIITKDDSVFFIREGKTQAAQADILSKVEACLFDDAIQFTYNGFYGSCQTFCSKILGSSLYSELNPEAAYEDANRMKAIAGWFLSNEEDSDELIRKMTERFDARTPFDELPQEGENLFTTCPDRLGQRLTERMSLSGSHPSDSVWFMGI